MDFKKNDDDEGKGDVSRSKSGGGRIESIVLSTAYTAITVAKLDKWIVILLTVCDAFQLLHFSMKKDYMLSDSVGTFFNAIGGFTTDYSTFQILFYLAFIVVLLSTTTLAVIAAYLNKGQLRSDWPLKVIRITSFVLRTVLFIPIMNIFVSTLHCNYISGDLVLFPEHRCFGGGLFMYIGGIIGLFLIIPNNYMAHTMDLDARPSPKHFFATQAQGHSGTAYSVARMVLVFVHILTSGVAGGAYIALISNCVAFGYLTYVFSLTLPFHAFVLNRLRVGAFVGIFLSSISAIISYAVIADETSAFIGQIVTAVVGFAAGSYVPIFANKRITRSVFDRIKEEIDSNEGLDEVKKNDVSKINTNQDNKRADLALMFKASKVDLIATTHVVERPPIFMRETDVEISCRFVSHNNTPEGRGLMHIIFRSGLRQYPKSTFLHATYALYMHEFDPETNKEAQQIVRQCSKQLRAKFAERALLFFVQRTLETSLRSSGGDDNEMSISSFAEYESLEASARFFHTQTLEEMKAFWGYLSSNNMTARALPVFAQKILAAERQGDEFYKKLISRFPKSKVILRMYATWLGQVKNDPESANNYLELANQIENNETNQTVKNAKESVTDDDDLADGDSDTEDNERVDPIRGPGPSLMMKKKTHSFDNDGGVDANFHVHTNSNFDFTAQPPNSMERPGGIRQTASLHDDEPQTGALPNDFDEEKIRRGPFLEHDGAVAPWRPSENRVVMNAYAAEKENLKTKKNGRVKEGTEGKSAKDEKRGKQEKDEKDEKRGKLEKDEKDEKDEKGDEKDAKDEKEGKEDSDDKDYKKGPRSESNASSSASTKASRMRRVLKAQLELRLTNDIYSFKWQIIFVNLVFLALVIATYIVATGQFNSFDLQLISVKISTQLGSRAVLLSHLLREQLLAARENDEQGFLKAKSEYFAEITPWKTEAIPFLQQYYKNPYWVRQYVSQYPNGTGQYVRSNEFGIGGAIYQNGLQLNNMSIQDFADPSIVTNNYFRYFAVSNMLAITKSIDMLSNANQDAFVVMSEASMSQLYGLIGIVCATVLGTGLLLFYPMLKKSGTTQVKVMKFFTMISKKACRHIYTNIEEDLETFVESGNDQQIQLANEAKLRVSAVIASGDLAAQNSDRKFLRIYAMWLTAILVSTLVVFIPPIAFELEGVQVVKTIIWSDSRRYKVSTVLRVSLELACHDDITYLDYLNTNDVVANLKDQIAILDDFNELVTSNHGNKGTKLDITPLAEMEFLRDITNIPGRCLLLAPNACDPANRVYNSSIGLTQDLVTSGFDNVLNSFISASKRFVDTDPKELDVRNRYYLFNRQILNDIRDGLTQIIDRLLAQQSTKSTLYKGIMEVLFPFALLVILLAYVAFRSVALQRISEMHQIVQLLFSVPPSIMEETPQFSQYIQSGGMLGLEENE